MAGSSAKRPYLVRALHEWMSDNGLTPHLVVAADSAGVQVPMQFVEDGRIVLNVSFGATSQLVLGNEEISCEARFGGKAFRVVVPMAAVLGIYARESGEGLVFPTDEYGGGGDDGGDGPEPAPESPSPRPTLKIVK